MNRYICTAIVLVFILIYASTTNKSKILRSNSSIKFNDSIRENFNAINDYLETVKEFSTEKVIIVKEKISSNLTIRLFKVNKIWAIDSMGDGKFDETFYDEKDWKIMNNAYKNRQLTEKMDILKTSIGQ